MAGKIIEKVEVSRKRGYNGRWKWRKYEGLIRTEVVLKLLWSPAFDPDKFV